MKLPITSIRTDGGTQPRASLDFDAIDDYADCMAEGAKFPPVTVFYDGDSYWLADGFHRLKATVENSVDEIEADVRQGTREDAQWFSFSANKSNGLRRTNDDKQRAVKAALSHPNGVTLSDSQIAKHVGVDHVTVSKWREKLIATCEIHKSDKRTGLDGRTINTANIGRRVDLSPVGEVPSATTPAVTEIAAPKPAAGPETTAAVPAEKVVERGLKTFVAVGNALKEINEQRLYREQGYATFEDYCKQRWGMALLTAYQHIAAATANFETGDERRVDLSPAGRCTP